MSVETLKRTESPKAARSSRKPLANSLDAVPLIDVFAGCGSFSKSFVSYRKAVFPCNDRVVGYLDIMK